MARLVQEEPVALAVQAVQAVRLRVAPAGPEAVCFRAVVVADWSLALP